MQISLDEVRKVAVAYRQNKTTSVVKEHVPEPVPPAPEKDLRLALELARQLANEPEVRAERVAEVRQQMTAGSYRLSSRLVAGAIVRRLIADRVR